jgi:phosphoesterase RecJ-like protein
MKNSLAEIAAAIAASSRIMVTTHRSPDGDGLGAALALARGIRSLGKDSFVYNADPFPKQLRFFPLQELLVADLPAQPVDAVVMCDCAEPERVHPELTERVQAEHWIVLDHHATERLFGTLHHNDEAAPATCEIVLALLKELGAAVTHEMAVCLYAGLAVDTGTFRFSNATARAFRAATELVSAGVDASRVAHYLFEEQPVAKLKLTARALDTLEISLDGRLATLTVDEAMLQSCGAGRQDMDGLVNFPRALAGCAVAALLFAEGESTRISLRTSLNEVDVEQVARRFGGGGHQHASGCSIEAPVKSAKAQLEEAVARMLAEKLPA